VGQPSDRQMTLEIRLLSFSTGLPHPLSEQPIVFITTKSLLLGHCNVVIEIVGDFLALLIIFPQALDDNEDMFFLVRWKKGEAHSMSLPGSQVVPSTSEWGAHLFFAFLSQDTLVFANHIQNILKVVKIVIDNADTPCLVPLCVLHLPPLAPQASINHLACRAEPNPTGSGPSPFAIPAPSDRPFRDKAEDAIVMFTLFTFTPNRGRCQFTFIVHRHALFAHIPAALRACAPFCSAPRPAPPPVQVPWAAWGVPATRWFEGDPASMRWITTTAGQRSVTMENGGLTPIIVRDFNPYAVRAARALAAASGNSHKGNWSKELPNGNRMTLKVEDSVIAAGSEFEEDVRSSLPYVEIVTQAKYRYEGVLIDEERILGLKVRFESSCHDPCISRIDPPFFLQISHDSPWISSFDVHVLG